MRGWEVMVSMSLRPIFRELLIVHFGRVVWMMERGTLEVYLRRPKMELVLCS